MKMFNKATDAVSKMTIKMNESDIVSVRALWAIPVLALEPFALPSSSCGCRETPPVGNQLWISPLQWFEEKLQEVECEDQRLRKLHAVVETLVNHRKGDRISTSGWDRHPLGPAWGSLGPRVPGTLPRRWDSAIKDSLSLLPGRQM